MADVKISGLPNATTPVAGTEVLPIVQGGQTRKVSIDNLTAGKSVTANSFIPTSSTVPTNGMFLGAANSVSIATNTTEHWMINASGNLNPVGAKGIGTTLAPVNGLVSTQITSTVATGTAPLVVTSTTEVANLRAANATSADTANQVKSNATTGVMQIVGPAASSTRIMTIPDANFTAARTDAAQSFTGDQTLSTGNLVIGTSGKGIDFSINPNPAGATSELLTDYEEGTWTPTVLGSTTAGTTTYTAQNGTYVKVGNMVYCQAVLIWTAATGTGNLRFGGLPFSSVNLTNAQHSVTFGVVSDVALTANNIMTGVLPAASTTIIAFSTPVGGGGYNDVAIDGAGYVSYSIVYRSA